MRQPILTTDLEERLFADESGGERDAVLSRLDEMRRRFRRELDRGVSPDRYRQLNNLIEAADVAANVVPRLWERLQAYGKEKEIHG